MTASKSNKEQERKPLLARIAMDKASEQTLFTHSQNVAASMHDFCAPLGLSQTGKLIGFLHDIGKSTEQWQNYLITAKDPIRHAFQAAKAINEFHSALPVKVDDLIKTLLGAVMWGHHSGLRDLVSPDGDKCYYSDLEHEQAGDFSRFFEECLAREKAQDLYAQVAEEIQKAIKHISCYCKSRNLPFLYITEI